MQLWEKDSIIIRLLDQQRPFASPSLITYDTREVLVAEDLTFLRTLAALYKIKELMVNRPDEIWALQKLTSLVQGIQSQLLNQPVAVPVSLFAVLREMTFWLPLDILQRVKMYPVVMVLLAHMYAVALSVQSPLSVRGGLYMTPIENIHHELLRLHCGSNNSQEGDLTVVLNMMEYPLETLKRFRPRTATYRLGPEP
jgi:hypothetical protein